MPRFYKRKTQSGPRLRPRTRGYMCVGGGGWRAILWPFRLPKGIEPWVPKNMFWVRTRIVHGLFRVGFVRQISTKAAPASWGVTYAAKMVEPTKTPSKTRKPHFRIFSQSSSFSPKVRFRDTGVGPGMRARRDESSISSVDIFRICSQTQLKRSWRAHLAASSQKSHLMIMIPRNESHGSKRENKEQELLRASFWRRTTGARRGWPSVRVAYGVRAGEKAYKSIDLKNNLKFL